MTDAVGERTLTDLLDERVEAHPTKPFVVFEDAAGAVSELTYAEFAGRTERVAAGLRDLGVAHGDRVLVHLRNSTEFLLCWFALARLGAVMVPSNVANTAGEVAYLVTRARVAVAVIEASAVEQFARVREDAPVLTTVLVTRVSEAPPGTSRFDDLDGTFEATAVRSADVCQILFTSGTTAKPKGVMVTHANALWSGIRMSYGQGLDADDRCLTALPLFHVNGQSVTVLAALTAGATVILLEAFDAPSYLDKIRAHRATHTSVVAAVAKALLATPARDDDADHDLRRFAFAINVSDTEKAELEKRFGVHLINIYGLSEACETVTMSPVHGPQRWPSVGLPALDRRVRIIAADGGEAAVGEPGEIHVHGVPGRSIMAGYFEDPAATAEVLSDDGWLRTGDLGHLDAAGYLFFGDRAKNVIKSSGQNVSTTEVEEVIALHPDVVEAGVIAIGHERWGEAGLAYVVPEAGRTPSSQQILDHCATHLSRYKIPVEVRFLDALPRTSVGKLAKGELTRLHREGEPVTFEFVDTRVEDGIYVLTLNRPDRLNAINRQLDLDWLHALQEAEQDPDVRVVVQQGAGRMFSAGHDLVEVGEVIRNLGPDDDWNKVYEFIWPEGSPLDFTQTMRTPTISSVHGHVVGQGVFQVLATDLVVAAPGTIFNLEVMRTGGSAGAAALSGMLPVKLVNEVALLGRLRAEEMYACGAINRLVPEEDREATAMELARAVAGVAPSASRDFKDAMSRTLERRGIGDFAAAFDEIRDSHGSDEDNRFWAMAAEIGVKEALAWRDQHYGPRR